MFVCGGQGWRGGAVIGLVALGAGQMKRIENPASQYANSNLYPLNSRLDQVNPTQSQ